MSKLRHFPEYVVARSKTDRPEDRRETPRFAAEGAGCWLGWWEGGAPRIEQAALQDVSTGGASFATRSSIPLGGRVWIRPMGVPHMGWIEASVVRSPTRRGMDALLKRPVVVGIGFREDRPWESLRALLFEGRASDTPEACPPLPAPEEDRP